MVAEPQAIYGSGFGDNFGISVIMQPQSSIKFSGLSIEPSDITKKLMIASFATARGFAS